MSDRYAEILELWQIEDDWGHPATALDEWRERFGAVPAALDEYYATLGAHAALNFSQDQLVAPTGTPGARFEIGGDDDTDVLVFYVENQVAVQWGVLAADVHADDPRVYMLVDDEWQSTAATVSEFLIVQAHLQWIFSSADWSEDFLEIDAVALERLRGFLPPRGVTVDVYGGVEFFGGPGVVLAYFVDSSSVVFGCADEHLAASLMAWFGRNG